jgi:transcriptional regulator with XRE-family HTH domain
MEYSFGEKLKELRTKRNLTQDDLANELNTTYGTTYNKGMISKWENDREEPMMDTIRNISKYFKISLDELLNLNIPHDGSGSPENFYALNPKDERDIAKDLEKMLADLESNQALAFNGEPMDEETKRLFHISLESSMRLAKEMAKQKFTPNKYKK